MSKRKTFKQKYTSFLYDHLWLKYILEYGFAFIMSVISAAIFAFGIVCFMRPGIDGIPDLVSGGSSGLAQTFALIFEIAGINIENHRNLIFSICYIVINLPLICIAFFGIGKRFAAFTIVNVGSVFLFSNLFELEALAPFFNQIAIFINGNGGLLARALFAGLCTGLSSGIAFKIDSSAGGFDIISYYISLRKGNSTGPYIAMINGVIIASFYLLTGFRGVDIPLGGTLFNSWTGAVSCVFFSLIYLVETMLIVDLINVRNKKVQIQINTANPDLPRLLLANVPHGATVVNAKGAYSGNDRLIIYLVVSTYELKQVISFIKEIDPESFVNVTSLQQVVGRFYMKPVK